MRIMINFAEIIIPAKMKRVLLFFFKYYFYWVLYFILFRVLFVLYNFTQTMALPWKEIFGIFWHGLKMDFSVAGYFSVLPGILLSMTPFIRPVKRIIKGYTVFLIILVTVMGLADMVLYPAWGSRLNAQILPYLLNPSEMLSCMTWWQFLALVVLFSGLVSAAVFSYNKFFKKEAEHAAVKWHTTPVLIFLSAALLLPIRGGLDTSPLNSSSVYFSQMLYANHCAYNYFWSFSHAVLNNTVKTNPVHYMDEGACMQQLNGLDQLNQEKLPVYIKNKTGKPTNVILVILESFSNKVIEPLGGLPGVTPRLNQLCKEGILFSSFYSTGNRSDKGLSSLIGSYPALIKASSVLSFPDKMKNLDCLPAYFGAHHYDLSFFYGGDINFYNVRMLMMQSGVRKPVTRNDFPRHIADMQNWGVPDQYLYQRMFEDLQKKPQPFLSMVYNISSHEPFDVPSFTRIKGNSQSDKYCNSVAYADSCLGHFIDQLKKSPLWANTLVVITSDHTAMEPGPTTLEEPATYRIPLLWTGGVIDTSFVVKNIAMQTDLSSTLVQQMGWKPRPSYFSKNIFGSRAFAFYYRDEGWGFLSPEWGFFMNIESGKRQDFYGGGQSASKDSLTRFSEAFTQHLHDDFLKK